MHTRQLSQLSYHPRRGGEVQHLLLQNAVLLLRMVTSFTPRFGPARRFTYISGCSPVIIPSSESSPAPFPLSERPEPFTVKLSLVTERRSQDSDCTYCSRASVFRQKKKRLGHKTGFVYRAGMATMESEAVDPRLHVLDSCD